MSADAYVIKCLRTKRKKELLGLELVVGIPLRKSWTKEKIITSIAEKYEEDPGILFRILSQESADFLRKRLRNPGRLSGMKESIYEELVLLGLVEKRHKPAMKTGRPVEESHNPVEDSLFAGSEAKAFLLEKHQAGLIRRLEGIEKVIKGMLRAYGLLDTKDLTAMTAQCCLEPYGPGGQIEPSAVCALEDEIRVLLRCRLSLRTFIRTYRDGGSVYLYHPSVTDPERLRYSILASPVNAYREFTFEELVDLGTGDETSGMAFLGLMDLFGKHSYEAKEILHIKFRIREGAPNLEIVREVMERLSFEDHQEVSRFLERFISHCDDIPRWNLKGYRMNEI